MAAHTTPLWTKTEIFIIYNANESTLQYQLFDAEGTLLRDRDGTWHTQSSIRVEDVQTIYVSDRGTIEPLSYGETPAFDQEALLLLSNLQTVYDYYAHIGVTSISLDGSPVQIDGVYNDYMDGDTTNAYCWGYARYNMGNDWGYVHNNSTAISHAAYLMYNGINGTGSKKLSSEELAELWYRAILVMPANCDFYTCRQLVELTATSMELTTDQIACVSEAFDAVGITGAAKESFAALYDLALDSTLSVYSGKDTLETVAKGENRAKTGENGVLNYEEMEYFWNDTPVSEEAYYQSISALVPPENSKTTSYEAQRTFSDMLAYLSSISVAG